MARACASKKTVNESNSTNVITKVTSTAKKTTARKTTSSARAATKTTAASKASMTKPRATKSSSKQATMKTKTSTRVCTTSKKTTTKAKASPTPVVEEQPKPKRTRKTKSQGVDTPCDNLTWVSPCTGLVSTARYNQQTQMIDCKLSITDGKSDKLVECSFPLSEVVSILKTNYNIATFVLQNSLYSFEFKRVEFEKFLRDNKIKLDLPKLAWV